MKIDELIKKPIGVIVENNILDDMIFPETTTSEFLDKIISKIKDNLENFLFVYVNSKIERKIKTIITSENLNDLVGIINSHPELKKVEDLKLEEHFPPRLEIEVSEPISSVLEIFKTEKTDIIVVKSVDGTYLGKIRKSKLKEWFTIMTS